MLNNLKIGTRLSLGFASLLLLMGGILLLPALGGRLAQALSPLASHADGWSSRFDSRTLPGSVKIGWAKLRGQLGAVAAAYNVPWKEEKEAAPAE